MLRKVICTAVIFSILKLSSAYSADDPDTPHIAVIGGGYTGIISGILLARLKKEDGITPALNVHLFEKELTLMSGASIIPARLHLGGEYALDETTRIQCLFSALLFRQMLPTESILTDIKYTEFLVAQNSTGGLPLATVNENYSKLKVLYEDFLRKLAAKTTWKQSEVERRLFGSASKFFEPITPVAGSHFAGGIKTAERGFQPYALGVILESLLKESNVKVHLGCTVRKSDYRSDLGYNIQYVSNGGASQEFFADYVVSSAWHENTYLATSANAHTPPPGERVTKVYLRSIGLYDVSKCTNIPQNRSSYFGLIGTHGGMVSFYSPDIAAIYIPTDDLSLQGAFDLTYARERSTFLPTGAQNHLDSLNGPTAQQSRILNAILTNAKAKYPFLKDAEPITLLSRTTVSLDDDVKRRSHVKPSWPLGEKKRWLEAESTKATFTPITALQVLREIIQKSEIRTNLSPDAKSFLESINTSDFTSGNIFNDSLIHLPAEFVLFQDSKDHDLIQMQLLYALRRTLPFAIMKQFSSMASILAHEQISIMKGPKVNYWRNLEELDLRSIVPTTEYLEALATAMTSLPTHKPFKSFRFQSSLEHAQVGLKVLKALYSKQMPIDELEIDQLCLTQPEEMKTLINLILKSCVKSLSLTRFSTQISPESFSHLLLLSLDKAKSLQSVRILFKGTPTSETVGAILHSFNLMPNLSDFTFSHNHLGAVLGNDFSRLLAFIESARKLKYFDLSDNALFTGPGDPKNKEEILKLIKERPDLNIHMRDNGLSFHEEKSKQYLLSEKLKKDKETLDLLRQNEQNKAKIAQLRERHTHLSQFIQTQQRSDLELKRIRKEHDTFSKKLKQAQRDQRTIVETIQEDLVARIASVNPFAAGGVTAAGGVAYSLFATETAAPMLTTMGNTVIETVATPGGALGGIALTGLYYGYRYYVFFSNKDIFVKSLQEMQRRLEQTRGNRASERTFHVTHDDTTKSDVERLTDDFKVLGFSGKKKLANHANILSEISEVDDVIVAGSNSFKESYDEREITPENIGNVSHEMDAIRMRMFKKGEKSVVPVHFTGTHEESLPTALQHIRSIFLSKDDLYYVNFFDMLEAIFTNTSEQEREILASVKEGFMSRKKD